MIPLLAITKVVSGIPLSHLAIGLSGLTFLFVLPAIFDPRKVRVAFEDFFSSGDSLVRVAALFHLTIAFLILNTRWGLSLKSLKSVEQSIIPLVGYLLLLRGMIWLWFPSFVRGKIQQFLKKDYAIHLFTLGGFIVAMGLGYLGIWVLE